MRWIALDTETTGLDFWHGARPYLVTICDSSGDQTYWEWDVDPLTRQPVVIPEDVAEIQSMIDDEGITWVMHNSKFDVRALESIGVWIDESFWGRVYDSVIAAHLVNSSEWHDLTSLAMRYLRVDLSGYDKRLMDTIRRVRRVVEDRFPEWKILRPGDPLNPSSWTGSPPKLKSDAIKGDGWLLREYARMEPNAMPEYSSLLSEYANADSSATIYLAEVQRKIIEDRGLQKIFDERMRQIPVIYYMENDGISVSKKRLTTLKNDFSKVIDVCSTECLSLSRGYLDEMPRGGRSKKLEALLFDEFGLSTDRTTKKGSRAMDKFVMEDWINELDQESEPYRFIDHLRKYRKRQVARAFLESYEKFWVQDGQVYLLHPSVHMTGTSTLRTTSDNPNEQQISNQEEANVRYCFGPAEGREWWSLDYENIELRIPAYESGEKDLIDLFERAEEPPFYGSEHLLNFSIVYPDVWDDVCSKVGVDQAGPWIKKNYTSTWYKWIKNGDFAVGYGAIDRPNGTADKAFRRPGSHSRLKSKFMKKEALNQRYISMAERLGYVETLPDSEVDPERGYPLTCPRGEYGRISPTIPLNYCIQGTACWVIRRATVKVRRYLNEMTKGSARLIMDVHDELVLDFPKVADRGNLPIVTGVQKIMQSMGGCIGVPLKVGVSYHPRVWSRSE